MCIDDDRDVGMPDADPTPDVTPTPDVVDEEVEDNPCELDEECGEGAFCNLDTGECVEGCLEDRHCGEGFLCAVEEGAEAGECVEGCREDLECDDFEICVDNACEVGCRDDRGCPERRVCDDGECVRVACTRDSDCEDDRICEGNACVPPPCEDDIDCGDFRICTAGDCFEGCRLDDDCPENRYCERDFESPDPGVCELGCRPTKCDPGEICDLESRLCVERPCGGDDECQIGQICDTELGACIEGCRGDGNCLPAFICEAELCISGCREDDTCPTGTVCEDSACIPGCRKDEDCPEDTVCDEEIHECVDSGCREDDDCPLGFTCTDRECVRGECIDDDSCGEGSICEAGVCLEGCRFDEECEEGQICKEFQCREGCRTDDECEGDESCVNEVCVGGCLEDNQCPEGAICEANVCVEGCRDEFNCDFPQLCRDGGCEDRDCVVDAQCPPSSFCNENICTQGCRADEECGEGEICAAGECRLGCREDENCLEGSYCDEEGLTCEEGCREDECPNGEACIPETRRCEDAPCNNDFDCPLVRFCNDEDRCAVGCRDDGVCGEGQLCAEDSNTCVDGCRIDGQCADDQFCLVAEGQQIGECNEGCRVRGCPSFQTCALDTRECVDVDLCGLDEECGETQICEEFVCITGCRGDDDCADGLICDDDLVCRVGCREDAECPQGQYCTGFEQVCASGCRGDEECQEGTVCIEGPVEDLGINRQQCLPTPCDADDACPDTFYCDGEAGFCKLGCREDGCTEEEFCDVEGERECVPRPCSLDSNCEDAEICIRGRCEFGCRFDSGCDDDAYCDIIDIEDGGICRDGCRERGCEDGEVCDTISRLCVVQGCRNDENCEPDEYCRDQVECKPGCRSDELCGEGLVCRDDERECLEGCREEININDTCEAALDDIKDILYDQVLNAIEGDDVLCFSDLDHAAYTFTQGDRIQLKVQPGRPAFARILSADCLTILAETEPTEEDDRVEFIVPETGTYVVQIRAVEAFDTLAYNATVLRQFPNCTEDNLDGVVLEPNNEIDQAQLLPTERGVPLEVDTLAACNEDGEDWFRVQVDEVGDRIHATLRQDPDAEPLAVEIFTPDGVIRLAESSVDEEEKTASTLALGDTGAYLIRVRPTNGVGERGIEYSLRLDVANTDCLPDPFESNNSIDEATFISERTVEANICQADFEEDWYSFVLVPGDQVNITTLYDHDKVEGGDQLPITLFGPGGEDDVRDFMIRLGDTDIDRLALNGGGFSIGERDAGEWFISVGSIGGSPDVDYALNVIITSPNCSGEPELTPNESCEQATAIDLEEESSGFICGPTRDEDWFAVNIPPEEVGNILLVESRFFHFDGNLDMDVYHPDGVTIAAFSNSVNDNESVRILVQDPGLHCIRMYTSGIQVQNRYTLDARME